ncbi:phosphotransferase enzyme family protein [Thermostichus vulcanus]|uniref:phosphotransferase enzyme family protein n=1 Tax=Thermostichus vulcanus TaxID=32053 RepID=UPI001FCA7CA8|nr:phosphotransferase [Thermostichus vulcanus]
MSDLTWLDPLTQHFQLGDPEPPQPIQIGLIHQTWKLSTPQGSFIAQRLHPIFDPTVTEDGQTISQWLRQQGFPTPQFCRARDGSLHLSWAEGLWRVMECLPGFCHQTPPDWGYLEQAGAAIGRLHQLLARFEYRFRFRIPHFHDTVYIWRQLQRHSPTAEVQAEWDFLINTVPTLFLPSGIPTQIIHADLKFNNFLFDEQGQFVGLLDLDTFMHHNLYIELGDALRSWGKRGETLQAEAILAGLRGYAQTGNLRALQPELILQGIQLITLELAMRFLQDWFEDCYWNWDPERYPSRKAHNLARCRQQIRLYQALKAVAPQLLESIRGL